MKDFYAADKVVVKIMKFEKFLLTLTLLLLSGIYLFAQTDKAVGVRAKVVDGKRWALVIGNANYKAVGRLNNTLNDSREMRSTLTGLGFSVIGGDDLSDVEMKKAIKDFGQKLSQGGIGLFYYSGHGIQAGGRNYLIPIDAPDILKEEKLEFDTVDVNRVLAEMSAAKNGFNIVILDACRNNPFSKGWRDAGGGLAQIKAPTGTLIAYATAPDTTASDGTRKNGTYTEKLLQKMLIPNIPIEQVFKSVSEDVFDETGGKQDPWYASSLKGDFYLKREGGLPIQPNIVPNYPTPVPNNQPESGTNTGIAFKDLGRLRIVLKSVMPVALKNERGSSVNGIRCTFEFINRDPQSPISVAINAYPLQVTGFDWNDSGAKLGTVMRATLLDENGAAWGLYKNDITGISIVSVGLRDSGGLYSPTDISALLQRRDETGTSKRTLSDSFAFVYGSMTPIPADQSVTVMLNFAQDAGARTPARPKSFQFASEIVVGVAATGMKKLYTLNNVTFDQISLTAR
jgi:hypothetical protein